MNGRIAKKKADKMCKEKLKISGANEYRACHKSSQGWRGGESARLPPMWPGFKSRGRRHRWVEFVVGSLLCSERSLVEQAPVNDFGRTVASAKKYCCK